MLDAAVQHVPAQLLADLTEGYLTLDGRGIITYLNPAAARFTGLTPEVVIGTNLWQHFPEVQASHRSVLEHARTEGKVAEFDTYSEDRQQWRTVRIYPHAAGYRILLHDLAGKKRVEEYSLRLLTVSDLLGRAGTPHEVAQVILEYAHATSDAYAGVVALIQANGTALEILTAVGYPPEILQVHDLVELTESRPMTDAFRTRTPLFLSRRALEEQYPDLLFPDVTASVAVFPLIAGDVPAGVLVFSFPTVQTFATVQRAYLQVLATQCAQALVRAQQYLELVGHTASSRVILDALDEGLLVFDSAGHLAAVNAAAQRFFDLPPGVPQHPHPCLDLAGWEFRTEDGAVLNLEDYPITCAFREGKSCAGTLIKATRPDGETRWLSVNARPLYRPGEVRPFASMASLADITRQKTYEQRLTHQATHDDLTGLFNRSAFLDRVTATVQGTIGSAHRSAVLVLDLDRFRTINDGYGGIIGDAALCEVAARLTTQAGTRVTIARLSGDEFGILLSPVLSTQDAELFARGLQRAVAEPIQVHGHDLHFTASLGISLIEGLPIRASLLAQQAYQALTSAQQGHGAGVVIFDADHARVLARSADLEHHLRRALRDESLTLAFQPIVDLQTTQPVAAEALVRWQHPVLGPVSPAEFIPIAEQRGLILQLGEWVLKRACLTATTWQHARVAVNVSRLQFNQPDFVNVIRRALLHANLPAERLELEITETAVADDLDTGITQLQRLREMGVRVALDDFGTGQSSLSSLSRLPIDVLKLDRSFVSGTATDPRRRAMVEAVIGLAGVMGVPVVGEGIEQPEEHALLRQFGCAYGQGYLFARPAPAEDLTDL